MDTFEWMQKDLHAPVCKVPSIGSRGEKPLRELLSKGGIIQQQQLPKFWVQNHSFNLQSFRTGHRGHHMVQNKSNVQCIDVYKEM